MLYIHEFEQIYNPAILLLGIYISAQDYNSKHTCTHMSIAALVTITNTWKQPKCPQSDEWIKKMWCVYIVEYYSAIKKNEIILRVSY